MIEARVYFEKSLKKKQTKKKVGITECTGDQLSIRRGGKGLLLWCLFHPLPNNPQAPNFQSIAFFVGWKHHKASFISLAFWQFSFSKCKCYIWKRQESSLLPESLLLSPSSAELLLLATTHSNILLYWRDSRLSPHRLNVCLFLKSQLTSGARSLASVGHPAIPSAEHL